VFLYDSSNDKYSINISHESQKGLMRFLLLIVIAGTEYSATENRTSVINWYMNHE
jgi:hypothetical protein